MRASRLTTGRLALLALAVGALHLLLIGRIADRAAAIVVARDDRPANRLAVRTVERTLPGTQAAVALQSLPADAALRDDARGPIAGLAPSAAAHATPGARHALPRRAARPAQRSSSAGLDPFAAPGSGAEKPSARDEAGSMAAPAAEAEPSAAGAAIDVAAASSERAPPIYPTRMPPAFAATYTLTRGAIAGDVELRWQPEGERYVARLEGRDGALLAWRSVGGFDTAGIAPQRFVDRRRGRGALAANFQRDTGKLTFSGPQIEHPLAPGMQDRLSWMLQLAAIAAADSGRVGTLGASLIVVGVHGEADVWNFEPNGVETIDPGEGAVPTLRLLRRPGRAYDTRAEVWLDPSRHYLPLRVRLSNGGETLQLEWRAIAPMP